MALVALSSYAQIGITTVAGQAGSTGSSDNAIGTSARFNNPAGLASDGTTIYIADGSNNSVRKLTISTGSVATLATGFNAPGGVAVDGSGTVYVADSSNHVIRKVTSTGTVTTLAGAVGASGSTNSTLVLSRFATPQGVAVNSAGTFVYVADTGNNLVRRIDVGGDAVTTIASGFKPWGLALNAAGTTLYVTDYGTHSIRAIDLTSSNTLTTVAGTVGTPGASDTPALFRSPAAITIDGAGDLYVADTGNHIIRKISGSTVTTIAGSAGSIGTGDGLGTSARFQGPTGIVATAANSLFIADTSNHTIRRALPATAPAITSASSTTFSVNTAGSFTVTATGSPAPGFSIVGGSLPPFATLNATTGVISGTPTTSAGSPFTFTIQASNGVSPAATQTFTLTVTQPPQITSASATTFAVNTPGTFTITATGSPAPTFSVTAGTFPPWASLNTSTGVISGTPSNNTGSPFTFTIQASNGVGTAAAQVFTLNVNTGAGISSHPSDAVTLIGTNATFSVVATGTPAPTYQWERQPAAGGSFTSLPEGGTYTGTTSATLTVNSVSLGMNGDKFRVRVDNGVGTAVTSNQAILTAAQVPAITSTGAATFVVNNAGSFSITSTGSPAPTYSITGGTFPPWASLNTTTGVISGTPTSTTGSPFVFQITASNGVNPPAVMTFTLTVSLADAAAAFSTHPTDVTVQLGQGASFTAVATGTPTPTLRWQRQPSGTSGFVDLSDDATYSGTTTGTLTLATTVAGMSGDRFRLQATNLVGLNPTIAYSNSALLTVNIGTAITTFAGLAGSPGSNDGFGTAARFNTPTSIAVDLTGTFYVADTANNVIRKITSGGVVSTLAGQAGISGSSDGQGSAARFNSPSGIAVDVVGNVYVADTFNHTIRAISPSGNVSTIAGLANNAGAVDGTGNAARFSFPAGIAVDTAGTIYVADSSNHTIRRVTVLGTVTTLAGTAGVAGAVDGNGASARFKFPNGLAVSSGGIIYVADSLNHLIRRVTTSGDVTTVAGGAGLAGSLDANGTSARFNQPVGVAVDNSGNVFVADTFNHTIRKISPALDVTTVAGVAGASGTTDGVGAAARFNQPYALTVASDGNLYIADTRNHAIRRSGTTGAPGIQTQPQNRAVAPGGTATFSVVSTGVPAPTYQWQRQPAGTTGFVNLVPDGIHSGVNTATLRVSNVLSSANGDQYRVVLSNGINPAAVSDAATLVIGVAPVITSSSSATFQAGQPGSFTFTTDSTSPVTFSILPALPTWASLNSSTGVLSGTPPDTNGSPFTFVVTADNGVMGTQTFTLTVLPANIAPSFSTQPASVAVDQGQSASFNVTAGGTPPLSYQWRRNGIPITGATASTLTLSNVQAASAGTYTVAVSNPTGTVISNGASLVVNAVPAFTSQPQAQMAQAGSIVTFSATATGGGNLGYQWRKNGVAIAGATNPTLTLTGVTAADAGNYDVQVSNAFGLVNSSLAQLMVVTVPTAPLITAQPAARTALIGSPVTLSVSATGAPAPSYQWRKNGTAIGGANSPTYAISSVQGGDAANYDVVVSNSAGAVTSSQAGLTVINRSYSGYYFGSYGGGLGDFALYVRDDNTGAFLSYLTGSTAPVMSLNVRVSDSGQFTFSQGAIGTALQTVTVTGSIANDGSVSGAIQGGASATFSGTKAADAGGSQGIAGFYVAGAGSNAGIAYTIAGANNVAFVVVQSGGTSDGGRGSVTNTGSVAVTTSRTIISETINASAGTVTGSATGAVTASFNGGSDAVLARQRLVNISSRARVASGDSVAIAGFVISGEESKPVLIRAVGPTLGAAPFNVGGALASPRLELFRGATSLAVNSGIAANRTAIDAAGQQAGAFALGASGADAAILTTLAPGNYTAVVSSATNNAGVALVEVYDLSAPAAGQKLLNIATRASAGTGDNTLIAGFVVPPGSSKRVLIRGVGPGLTPFGVTGVLAQPALTLMNGSTVVAQNTNWTTSTDAAVITSASAQVGAFGLANNDSAMVVTLAPGNYTAQVNGTGGATGVALIEVYELP